MGQNVCPHRLALSVFLALPATTAHALVPGSFRRPEGPSGGGVAPGTTLKLWLPRAGAGRPTHLAIWPGEKLARWPGVNLVTSLKRKSRFCGKVDSFV